MDQAHHHPVRTSALARHSADRSIAVVCGGGFAGLLAARVLTDAFDRVIVVERDQASRTGLRPGVPQGGHIHALMPGGRAALDRLIPGFSDRLVAAGGTRACLTSTSRRHLGGHWQPRFESELWSVLCTRPLFEQVLYDAVLDPTVHRTEGLEFVNGVTQGLLASDGRIDGVSIGAGAPSVGSDPATVVHADLVVDATGRRSRDGVAGRDRRRRPRRDRHQRLLGLHEPVLRDAGRLRPRLADHGPVAHRPCGSDTRRADPATRARSVAVHPRGERA